MDIIERVEAARIAADFAADELLKAHSEDWAARWPRLADGTTDWDAERVCRCVCGWMPKHHPKHPRRALGLHLSAVARRADKLWVATYDETMAKGA